ncbi:MAG: BON domain-containing protein [Alphaproteobacteria bacterium]
MGTAYFRRRRYLVGQGFGAALAVAMLLVSAACTPLGAVVGAGATVAVAAAEERGVSGAAADTRIRLEINNAWFNESRKLYTSVGLQVYEGRVLLTGVVLDNQMRDSAVKLAWQPDGVRSVINEILVGDGRGLEQGARDTWVSAQVKTQLLLEKNVNAINYRVKTVSGSVFLLGIAQDQAELDRVFEIVRNTRYVGKVVNHVLLRDDARRSL